MSVKIVPTSVCYALSSISLSRSNNNLSRAIFIYKKKFPFLLIFENCKKKNIQNEITKSEKWKKIKYT